MNELNFEDLDKYLLDKKGRIIHQVWFGTMPNKVVAKKDYNKLKKYRDSWIIKNPTWYHFEWNKSLCKKVIELYFPEYYDMYMNYPYEIQRCDAVRYCILFRYGGLYADMDYYCNKPFDIVQEVYRNNFYLVQTPNMVGEYISNSLMFSTPNHPFWLLMLMEMSNSQSAPIYYSRHLTIMYTTGPGIMNRVYHKYKQRYKLKSFPHKYFQPYGTVDDILSLNNPDVYTIHASKGCWHSNDSTIIVILTRNWKIFLFILFIVFVNIIYNTYSKKPNINVVS